MSANPANHAELRHLMGAYILGGLEPREAEMFELHLGLCPECASELASLQGLTALLDAVPAGIAILSASPDPVVGAMAISDGDRKASTVCEAGTGAADPRALMGKLSARRRRRRWLGAAVVSGVAAASLALGLAAAPSLTAPPRADESYSVASAAGPQVQVGLLKKAWGTELALNGTRLPQQGVLSLWVKDTAGSYDRAASWSATSQGKATVTGATPLAIAELASVEIRDASGKSIVVLSRADGN